MLISLKHKFIYIGINKTGSTSIEKGFEQYRNRYTHFILRHVHNFRHHEKPAFKHSPARLVRRLVTPLVWDNFFTFTVVRNPWARTLSEYTGHRHDESKDLKQGFTEWVLNGDKEKKPTGGIWLAKENTMKKFISDENGKVIVDYVAKLEDINKELPTICKIINIQPITLPKANQSKKATNSYRDVYTDETRDIVSGWVREDAEYFGYEF